MASFAFVAPTIGTFTWAHTALEKAGVECRKPVISNGQISGKDFSLEIPFAPGQESVTTFQLPLLP